MKFILLFALAALSMPAQKLQDVKTIYVAHFTGHQAEVADLVSAKPISALAKQPGITVVTDEDATDAILTGSGRVDQIGYAYGQPVGCPAIDRSAYRG